MKAILHTRELRFPILWGQKGNCELLVFDRVRKIARSGSGGGQCVDGKGILPVAQGAGLCRDGNRSPAIPDSAVLRSGEHPSPIIERRRIRWLEMDGLFEGFFRFILTTVVYTASGFALVKLREQTGGNVASSGKVDARVN